MRSGSFVLGARLNTIARLLVIAASSILIVKIEILIELHRVVVVVVIERVVQMTSVFGDLAEICIQFQVVLAFVVNDDWLRRI